MSRHTLVWMLAIIIAGVFVCSGWAVRWFEAYYVKRYESTVVPLKPYSEQRRYAYRHRGILRGDENDLDARDVGSMANAILSYLPILCLQWYSWMPSPSSFEQYGLQYRLMRLLDRTEEDSTEDSDASLDGKYEFYCFCSWGFCLTRFFFNPRVFSYRAS